MNLQSNRQVLLLSEKNFPQDFIQNYFTNCSYNVCQYSLNDYQNSNMNDINIDEKELSGIVLSGTVENSDVDNLAQFISSIRKKFNSVPILLLCDKKIQKEKRLEISKAAIDHFKALQGFKADKSVEKDLEKLTLDFFIST